MAVLLAQQVVNRQNFQFKTNDGSRERLGVLNWVPW
jgi:hypothetical protein